MISGSHKGRILKAVPGNKTRPTTDKVKESVFNMIGPFFENGIGLDLFAGSGGLGIEGLSRGLKKVIFVDYASASIQTIKTNLAACRLEERAEVLRMDYKKALTALSERNISFHAVWLDPPYKKENVYTEILHMIGNGQMLDDSGKIVCEHNRDLVLPEQIGVFEKWKSNQYGTIGVSIYRKLKGD